MVCLFVGMGVVLNIADNFYYHITSSSEESDWLLGGSVDAINNRLFLDNTSKNYLYFDLEKFLFNPYIDSWNDGAGRQFFWNFHQSIEYVPTVNLNVVNSLYYLNPLFNDQF